MVKSPVYCTLPPPSWAWNMQTTRFSFPARRRSSIRLFHLIHGQARGLTLNQDECEHNVNIYTCIRFAGFTTPLPPPGPATVVLVPDTTTDCVLVPLFEELSNLAYSWIAFIEPQKLELNLNYRISQAVAASKLLRSSSFLETYGLAQFSSISYFHPYLRYGQLTSIPTADSENEYTTPPHFMSFRLVLKIQSSFYHRVLDPSTNPLQIARTNF